MYSTTPYISNPSPIRGNGVVGVYVVNELTTPNSTVNNDIEVNVFVSMGDDFEVFVPDDHFQYFVAKPQSGMENGALVSESQNTSEPSAPQQEIAEELGPTMSDNSDINKVFAGESVASFRTMLKRYNLWTAISPLSNGSRMLAGRYSAYPFLRGNVSGAVHSTNLAAPYNYCNTVLLHWCTWAFSGWRGAIRYKILPRGTLNASERPTLYVQRHPIGQLEYDRNDIPSNAFTTDSEAAAQCVVIYNATGEPRTDAPFSGVKGQAYSSGYLNPTIEYEIPYYSPFRFTPGKEQDHTTINLFNEGYDWRIHLIGAATTSFDIHCAAGEDFQLYFFTGLPRLYYEVAAPAPAL
jgi:hypothetical protein